MKASTKAAKAKKPAEGEAGTPKPPYRTIKQCEAFFRNQLFDSARYAREQGRQDEKKEYADSKAALQIAQVQAITAMIQEASKMMSRAGYLLGKAHGKEGW